MTQRRRKQTVNTRFQNRFYNARFTWMSAEDRAWENMAPVGREFGSPDYERLAQEDSNLAKANLARLISECSRASGAVPESTAFRPDTINVQMALRELGHEVNLDTAARVWMHYSNSLCAGWMSGAQSQESARVCIGIYCWTTPQDPPGPGRWASLPESPVVASDDFSRRVQHPGAGTGVE
jgi:hypothetical protein